MAEMIQHQHSASGATLYALARNSAADVWDGAAYVPYATVDLASYALPMTEQGAASALYTATLPAGTWHVSVFVQGGGSPAEGDVLAAGGVHISGAVWDGNPDDHVVPGSFASSVSNIGATLGSIESAMTSISSSFGDVFIWLRLLFRNDAWLATDYAGALAEINGDPGGGPGTFDNTLHSVQAIAAAGGGGLSPAAIVKLEGHSKAVYLITVGVGSTTTSIVLATVDSIGGSPAAPPSGPDVFNRGALILTSGALAAQRCAITDYDGSTGTLTLEAPGFTGAAASGVTGVIS